MTVNTPKQVVAAYKKYGSLKAVARATGTGRETVRKLYQHALAEGLIDKLPVGGKTIEHIKATINGKLKVQKPKIEGRRKIRKAVPLDLNKGKVTRFLFTSAQNNTKLHENFWRNLLVLKEHYAAELHVSRFAYIKSGLGANGDKATWFNQQQRDKDRREFWFDERITPYVSDDLRQVAPGLVWRGDANILPTASRPLSRKNTINGRASGIFPHVKIALASVPGMERGAVKFNYTTGTVTQRNYIQRDAGFVADFHHCYGALLVEVTADGDWWCRQINADSEGTIYDLDICVRNGELTTGNTVEAITWGDVHVENADQEVLINNWGEGGVLDYLHPRYQFLHDTLDMYSRSHHEIDDPHALFLRYKQHKDNVRKEVVRTADFIGLADRPWVQTIIVNSNHDRALLKWLKNRTAMYDPINFQFWTRMNDRVLSKISDERDYPIVFEEAYLEVTGFSHAPKGITFLAQDDSFIICHAHGGGIECGEHGDDGQNGARGSTAGYASIGRKMNKGHDHTAGIIDGVYSAGTARVFRIGRSDYTHGPSSWSHSDIVTYKNGKRTIITTWAGKSWAPR
jgi:hypothetical protein